jgi:hypothetical protein
VNTCQDAATIAAYFR